MPIYEYRCEKCGVFEKKQSFQEETLKNCPTCNSNVNRLISRNVGVVYKGSGFYTTDTREKPSEKTQEEPKAPPCGESGDCSKSCPNAS